MLLRQILQIILLGCPWLHAYGVITSTLYQRFKFYKDGELQKVNTYLNIFQGEEVNYVDAKFYKSANDTILKDSKATTAKDKRNKRWTLK